MAFYEHKFRAQTVFSEREILMELPPQMRQALVRKMYVAKLVGPVRILRRVAV